MISKVTISRPLFLDSYIKDSLPKNTKDNKTKSIMIPIAHIRDISYISLRIWNYKDIIKDGLCVEEDIECVWGPKNYYLSLLWRIFYDTLWILLQGPRLIKVILS